MQIQQKEDAVRQVRQEIEAEVDELQQLYADLQNQRQAQGYHLTHHSLHVSQTGSDSQAVRAA